jgi:O-acetylserine/cysteine efflux transporter
MNTNRRHAVAALIAAGLLWGTTVPLSKLALEWLSPGWLTAARFGLAAAVLLAATPRAKLRAAFTPKVLVAGALGYGGSVMVQNAGITRTSVTHAALLIGAVPVLVAIIAAVWHRTVARPVAWIGFVVSLGGVGLVTVGGGGGGATMIGDGLVLASLFLSAAVTVAQGRLFIGRDPVAVTAVQFLGATLGALLVTVLTEGAPAVPSGPGPVLAVVALAAFGTLVPFTLFAFGQSRVSAEVAGAFLNLEPLVGAIAGAAAFGDPVGLAQMAGGAAIVAGIGLSSLPLLAGRRRSQAAPLALVAASPAAAGGGPLALVAASPAAAGGGPLALAGAEPLALASGPAPLALAAGPEPLVPALAAGLSGYGCDSLPKRGSRLPHPCHDPAHHGRRNGVFVVVYGGKFGAGAPGDTRPGPGRAGPRRRGGTWRGGAQSGRPPTRRRGPNPGMGPAASGRRAIGDRGRSWPGASRGRSAAGR